MPNIFGGRTEDRIIGHVKYRNTVITGEVTVVNINKTYNVRLAGEDTARPDIPTIFTNPDFTVGESVGVQFGRGNRESPVIIGRDRKKIQEPVNITYNYV